MESGEFEDVVAASAAKKPRLAEDLQSLRLLHEARGLRFRVWGFKISGFRGLGV